MHLFLIVYVKNLEYTSEASLQCFNDETNFQELFISFRRIVRNKIYFAQIKTSILLFLVFGYVSGFYAALECFGTFAA